MNENISYDDYDDDDYNYRHSLKNNLENEIAAFANDVSLSFVKVFLYLFGSSLAMIVSYFHNHSILWAMGHGFLSWGYVIYFAIFK